MQTDLQLQSKSELESDGSYSIEQPWAEQCHDDLPASPAGLRAINQQLWCCCREAGIVVFDRELQLLYLLLCDGMGNVCDVAEMSNGDVVIAASNGLFHTDNAGSVCFALSIPAHFDTINKPTTSVNLQQLPVSNTSLFLSIT